MRWRFPRFLAHGSANHNPVLESLRMSWIPTILLLLISFFASCGFRQPNDGESTGIVAPARPAASPVNIVTEYFEIELDESWKVEREGDSYVLNDEPNRRQVTIAVVIPKQSPDDPHLQELAREIVRIRRDAIRKISKGSAKITDVTSTKTPEGYELSFAATDPINQVKVRCITYARPRHLVTVSFNKYSPLPPDEEIDQQLKDVLAKFRLNDAIDQSSENP
jgi:hypothetical protein